MMTNHTSESGLQKSHTILVVDDNPTNLGVITSYLQGHGFEILIARDGIKGIERARQAQPSLILLDVLMPGIDGFETCQRLKADANTRDIPVIFMTALAATEHKLQGFRVGAVDYLAKPVQEQEVLARITTHLRLRELNERLEQLVQARTSALAQVVAKTRRLNQQLEQEIAERVQAEKELERHRDHLEELVQERTQELKEAQAELVRRERLSTLGQLTATIAHEIRNPLGTVRTSVFAIGDAIERDEMYRVERALQLAERNVVRCDAIISELLDYARERALHLRPTDIDAWLKAILDDRPIPQDIACTRELNCGLEIPIDSVHLGRAIINIMNNAIDALQDKKSPGNQLSVSTHVVEAQAGSSRLEIRFHDTGPGIPDDVLPRIFEPLFSTKAFGVGLGLPIVKNIMEQHSGGVNILSKAAGDEPEGTSVVLWLPVDSR
jgi:signal transduction histidine kinase